MEKGKYIIVEIANTKLAILFDLLISHDDLLRSFHRESIISAGFFIVSANPTKKDPKDISVSVEGRSITLKMGANKEDDPRYIKKVLRKEEKW